MSYEGEKQIIKGIESLRIYATYTAIVIIAFISLTACIWGSYTNKQIKELKAQIEQVQKR